MAFVYDDRGVQYNNEADMCLDYGIPVWAFKIRMAMQYPVGIALTAPKYEYRNLTCCDFRGVQFPTLYDMCDYYGVSIENFEARAEAEWDLRRILTMR